MISGASECTISSSAAKEYNICRIKCEPIILKGFGNISMNCDEITSVLIRIDDAEAVVNVGAVPAEAQPVEMIIGRSFLDQLHLNYVKQGETFKTGNTSDVPFVNVKLERVTRTKLKSGKSHQCERKTVVDSCE